VPVTGFKFVHKLRLKPDNFKLDHNILWAIEKGADEADVNRHVSLGFCTCSGKAIRKISGRRIRHTLEVMINDGKFCHCHLWNEASLGGTMADITLEDL
jgi:hypothetical protein